MKKSAFVLLFACFFILSSCGEETPAEVAADNSGLTRQRGNGYEMQVPASWEVVDSSKVTVPVHGKLELAMRSLIHKKGFMNNFTLLSDTLQADASASEYVRQSMLWASREYLTLKVDNEENITFADGQTSRLEIFHAKYNEVTEEHLFFQTARVCGTKVYLMTLGLENDTDPANYDRYREILKSFQCK